jgi:pimeloyl-ACP methyl ester carboxylesterase
MLRRLIDNSGGAMTWVLLRGLIREARHWETFPDAFRAQVGDEPVLTPDLPGNGGRFRDPSPTSVSQMVDILREDLRRSGHSPPYKVLALSLGAMTVVDWMDRHPEELHCSVLMNTSAGRFSPFWKRLRPAIWPWIPVVLAMRDRVRREYRILRLTSNSLDESRRWQLARRWAEYQHEAPVSTANSLKQLYAASRFRAPARLPESVPTLILNGEGDRLVHPDCSEALARAWRVALKRHRVAGHDLPLDAPDWVIGTSLDWVSGLP